MYTLKYYEIKWIFSNKPVYWVWDVAVSLQVYLPNGIPLWHQFSVIQRWLIPRGSWMSHNAVSPCVSRSVYIISRPFLTATTSITDEILFFSYCMPCITDFFSFVDRVWGGILFLSAQCGWMLHCFKWRIILCNLRDTGKSDFFKINSRDSCSDLAGIWRHMLFDQIKKYKFLSFLFYWDAMSSCRKKINN